MPSIKWVQVLPINIGLVWFYGISNIIGYLMPNLVYSYMLDIRGSLNKFPDFFRMGTFIDSTHIKLWPPSK